MSSSVYLKGMENLLKEIEELKFSKPQQKTFLRKVSRPAAKLLQTEVKRLIPTPTNHNLFPHIARVRAGVKVRVSKSKFNHGSIVVMKGNDVPMAAGKGKTSWSLRGYSMLVFFGNKDTKDRPHKGGSRAGVGQGNVKGELGFHPFTRAADNVGDRALRVFSFSIIKKLKKDWGR